MSVVAALLLAILVYWGSGSVALAVLAALLVVVVAEAR